MSKKVLITGGTKGIGRAVAEIFAENGYDIILTYAADQEAADSCEHDIRRRITKIGRASCRERV